MLTQILLLYGVSWCVAAAAAALLEWAQLTRRTPPAGPLGVAKALAIGWTLLPVAGPALLLLPLVRRAGRREGVRA